MARVRCTPEIAKVATRHCIERFLERHPRDAGDIEAALHEITDLLRVAYEMEGTYIPDASGIA
jgi:hypothetical protein